MDLIWKIAKAYIGKAVVASGHTQADLQAVLGEVAQAAIAGAYNKYEVLMKDVERAAGENLVAVPEPGTDASRLLLANVMLRRRNEQSWNAVVDAMVLAEEGIHVAEAQQDAKLAVIFRGIAAALERG